MHVCMPQNKSDGVRAKLYGKMGKLIVQAVRAGGPSADANSRLRDLLAQARASNIPKDIIERNIRNASSSNQADYVEVRSERIDSHMQHVVLPACKTVCSTVVHLLCSRPRSGSGAFEARLVR